MPTFDSYWRYLCEKNPPLRDEELDITLSTIEFARMLEMAYSQGHQDASRSKELPTNPFNDLLWNIFKN